MQAVREAGDPPLSTPPAYAGWFRGSRSVPWRQLVDGASFDEVWGKLLDKLAELSQRGGESTVVQGGVDPNKSASARARATR
jgi:hypothetical protein